MDNEKWRSQPVAVLVSGGIDSAVLVGELSLTAPRLVPIYVRFGLTWESIEEEHLRRYLAALGRPSIEPIKTFEMPIENVYGDHWSTGNVDAPGYETPDEAVFLPGRNLLLLTQPVLWCHLNGIPTIALGPLACNPFPDGTDEFFDAYEGALNMSVDGSVRIVRPYCLLSKEEVLHRGMQMPLWKTFSCIRPIGGRHCGQCNKCAERQRGFESAGILDRTEYAKPVKAEG